MDEYGNWIYLTPMILGGLATVLAAAWKFLGIAPAANVARWIRCTPWLAEYERPIVEAELETIEDEIDDILEGRTRQGC